MPLAAPPAMVVLYDSGELTAGASAITASGIPADYTDLRAILMGRGDNASAAITANITFNGDGGNNYDRQHVRGTQATASAGEGLAQSSINVAQLPAATAPSGEAGIVEAFIPSYAGTTFQKAVFAINSHRIGTTASASNLIVTAFEGFWRNTAAINSITFTASAGNFIAGSRMRVLGVL